MEENREKIEKKKLGSKMGISVIFSNFEICEFFEKSELSDNENDAIFSGYVSNVGETQYG